MNQAIEKEIFRTGTLSVRYDQTLEEFYLLRVYANGIIHDFSHIVSQVLEMMKVADQEELSIPIPGFNMKGIMSMVQKQLDAFTQTMPRETSYQEIQAQFDEKVSWKENEFTTFEQKLAEFNSEEEQLTRRQQFNDALEMEINKIIQAGKSSKQFLDKLSNELKSPLMNYLKFAENPSSFPIPIPAFTMPEDITRAAKRLIVLLNDYEFYKQLHDKSFNILQGSINPDEVLNKLIEHYTTLSYDQGFDLYFKIDANLPANLQMNEKGFDLLIRFMLDNAMNIINLTHYSQDEPASKITLIVQLEEQVNWRSQWMIATEDNSLGFPSEKIKDVFSFFSYYSEKDPFAALKFKMMEKLIDEAGGKLKLEKAEGKSRFKVQLGINLA